VHLSSCQNDVADDFQLEFSLLAVRDDPLPGLQAQLTELRSTGREAEAAEVTVQVSTEEAKRERWAVSVT
jgi:ubiquitin carboxyl-terminal hydrolase L5